MWSTYCCVTCIGGVPCLADRNHSMTILHTTCTWCMMLSWSLIALYLLCVQYTLHALIHTLSSCYCSASVICPLMCSHACGTVSVSAGCRGSCTGCEARRLPKHCYCWQQGCRQVNAGAPVGEYLSECQPHGVIPGHRLWPARAYSPRSAPPLLLGPNAVVHNWLLHRWRVSLPQRLVLALHCCNSYRTV